MERKGGSAERQTDPLSATQARFVANGKDGVKVYKATLQEQNAQTVPGTYVVVAGPHLRDRRKGKQFQAAR